MMRWKWPYITRSGNFPNQNQAIDFAEEAKKYILGLAAAFAFFAAAPAFATTCAAPVNGNSGALGVDPTYVFNQGLGLLGDKGCNVLITFGAGGSISTSFPNAAPSYDTGGDDNIVGIINNSGQVLPSLTLTGTSGAFGFEGDGACGTPASLSILKGQAVVPTLPLASL
jgi:hypothetical protein